MTRVVRFKGGCALGCVLVVLGVVRSLCASVRLGTPFTVSLMYCITVLLLHFPVLLPLRLCVQVVCTRLCASIPTQPLFQPFEVVRVEWHNVSRSLNFHISA